MISFVDLKHYSLHATDGSLGQIKDCLFDDQDFVIRYFAVDTSSWIPLSRKVLISPIAITDIDSDTQSISLNLSRELVSESPPIDAHKPVSREYEELLFQYFGYGYYWIGPGAWGDFAHPTELVDQAKPQASDVEKQISLRNHLRSCNEILGYDVIESDNAAGLVNDFVFDKHTWSLRELVVENSGWLSSSEKQHMDVHNCEKIDWPSHCVMVSKTKN